MKFKTFLESEMQLKIEYHNTLNPAIWDSVGGEYKLKPEVRNHLIKIGNNFANTLNLKMNHVIDFVLTGSNANFNWTELSDIDIHLTLNSDEVDNCIDCLTDYEDCLQAKKSLWNDRHDIKIYGFDVEVYVTTHHEELVTDSGSYSLQHDKWISKPTFKHITFDSISVQSKVKELASEIDLMINSKTNDPEDIQELLDKLSKMRSAGLSREGEFSVENLTFKALRNNGYIQKIRQYQNTAYDNDLSLE